MGKLKDLRIQANLTQSQIADLLKTNTPLISNFENDVCYPDLEDIAILENKFDTRIDWKENLTPNRKHQTVQALIELCEKYPLPVVFEFAARVYRREIAPDTLIIHYGNLASKRDEGILMPNIE